MQKKLLHTLYNKHINIMNISLSLKEQKLAAAKEIQSVFDNPKLTNKERLNKIDTIAIRCTADQKLLYTELAKKSKMPLSRLVRNSMNLTLKTNTLQPKKSIEELRNDFLRFQAFVQSL